MTKVTLKLVHYNWPHELLLNFKQSRIFNCIKPEGWKRFWNDWGGLWKLYSRLFLYIAIANLLLSFFRVVNTPGVAEGSNSSNSVDTKNKTPFFLTSNGKVQPPCICLLCQKAETGTDEKHQISIDFWSRIVAFCINQCLT